jgi:predicted anti-sigma-YlaC factor YlaD
MSQACTRWRGDIGAYIVGALEPAAAAGVRRHLRRCEACRSEYEDLLPVREWLTRLSTAGRSAPRRQMGGPVLRLVEPLRSRRGCRRWLVGAAAAVAAAAAGVVGVAASVGGSQAGTAFRAGKLTTAAHGQARLHSTAAGTRINLTVAGLPADERCRLVAVSGRGTDVAATWTASYDGSARIVGTSAIPKDQLIALWVESGDHRRLLTIVLTGSQG